MSVKTFHKSDQLSFERECNSVTNYGSMLQARDGKLGEDFSGEVYDTMFVLPSNLNPKCNLKKSIP